MQQLLKSGTQGVAPGMPFGSHVFIDIWVRLTLMHSWSNRLQANYDYCPMRWLGGGAENNLNK